jgi:hypothetical protein
LLFKFNLYRYTVAVHSFGQRLCYPAALRLAPREPSSSALSPPPPPPPPPRPALLPNPAFLFARSAALLRDCPPDPHAPFLYLGGLCASRVQFTRSLKAPRLVVSTLEPIK